MLRARLVLVDAQLAAKYLHEVLDPPRFRLYWAASCALLRSVGHVLTKVEAAIDAAWQEWRCDRAKHAIFWDFIEAERNLILKDYEIRADIGEHMLIIHEAGAAAPTARVLGPEYYIPLSGGPFAGLDCRELVNDALFWWDTELRRIESVVNLPDSKQGTLKV